MMFFKRLTYKAAKSGSPVKSGRWPAILNLVSGLLLLVLGVQTARLILALATPAGGLGVPGATSGSPAANAIAAKFDPFFVQAGPAATGVVTALPLKLFGTRIDFASGRGSAIIATPDGMQSSFSVGESVMPGTKLLTVAGDFVELERGGIKERLYLDQSVPAETAAPAAPGATPSIPTVPNPAPPPSTNAPSVAPLPPSVTQVQQTTPSGEADLKNQ